ncbi:MAG: hypothetical protein GEU79_05910 [Acidimicrobiia bacterium]|nr:hypothetical protein [Acidimicrobiia bacterium]
MTEEEEREVVDIDGEPFADYRFPDPLRRRTSGVILLVAAVALAVAAVLWDPGLAIGAAIAGLVGVWFLGSAWPLEIQQEDALAEAVGSVDFPVGHASAAVRFHGLRARPRWSVVLYEAAEPPEVRALITIDAINGTQPDPVYTEQI